MADRTTAQWATYFGLTYDPTDPLLPVYMGVLRADVPKTMHGFSVGNTDAGNQAFTTDGWIQLAILMLQKRHVLYQQRTPGDCAKVNPSKSSTEIAGGLQFGGGIAPTLLKSTPVIGDIVTGVLDVASIVELALGAPDQQILRERAVICPLSISVNANLDQLDSQVVQGQVLAGDAAAAAARLAMQADRALAPIRNYPNAANTGDCYSAFIHAEADFRALWYPAIAKPTAALASKTSLLAGGLVAAGGGAALLLS